MFLCSVVLGELLFGASNGDPEYLDENLALIHSLQQEFRSLPYDDDAAVRYARIRVSLKRLGTPIGPNDTKIAAIALANDLTLVTHNTAEFSRVPGLKLEDWQ